VSLIEIDPGPDDLHEFRERVARRQAIDFRSKVPRDNGGKWTMGGNEFRTADQVFGGINFFGLPEKRISAGKVRICLVGGVAPIAVAGHIDEVASQSDETPILPFKIERKRRIGEALTDSTVPAGCD